jgi:hypothetical protein
MVIKKARPWTPVATAVALAVVVPATGAGASSPATSPVTIHLHATTTQNATFTATGPVCASGTMTAPQLGQGLTKVFTCDDGSGSFAVHLNGRAAPGTSVPLSWVISPSYATGAYVRMRGSGTVTGGTCITQPAPCDADLAGDVT